MWAEKSAKEIRVNAEDQLLPVALRHGGEKRQMPVVRHQTRRDQASKAYINVTQKNRRPARNESFVCEQVVKALTIKMEGRGY